MRRRQQRQLQHHKSMISLFEWGTIIIIVLHVGSLFSEIFGCKWQMTPWNIHILGLGNNASPRKNYSYQASERTFCLFCTMLPIWNNPNQHLEIFTFHVLTTNEQSTQQTIFHSVPLWRSIYKCQSSERTLCPFCTTWPTWNNCKTLNQTQSSILVWCCHCSSHHRFLNSLIIYHRCCSTNVIAEIIGCVKEGGRDWTPSRMLAVILLTLREQNCIHSKILV